MHDLAGLTLDGVSVGGFATCVDVPELRLCVDVGRLLDPAVARPHVFITHTHADHVGALAQHVAQRGMRGMEPATYHVPPGTEGDIEELLGVWRSLDRGAMRATVRPLAPGEPLRLRRDLEVEAFETVHRVPSQGVHFRRVRTKLRPDLEGRPGPEIAAARAAGEEVDVELRESILAITGDTTIEGVLRHPEVLRARRLVMEVTFLEGRITAEEAERRGHVHLDHVAAAAERFECEHLLLCHLSPRHTAEEARRAVTQALPAELARRTTVWSNGMPTP